jgi:hypothetical protein
LLGNNRFGSHPFKEVEPRSDGVFELKRHGGIVHGFTFQLQN